MLWDYLLVVQSPIQYKTMNNKLKKTKFARLANQIANLLKSIKDFYLKKESFYLTFLTSVMLFMPYLHLTYYGEFDIKGDFFGFRWMSSFLFAIALPSFMLATGFLIRYFGFKYREPFLKLLSIMVIISGSFYMAWTFWTVPSDFKDISLKYYLFILLILTIGVVFLTFLINKLILETEKRFLKTIHYLFSVLYEGLEERKLINLWKKKDFDEYVVEITDEVIDIENVK